MVQIPQNGLEWNDISQFTMLCSNKFILHCCPPKTIRESKQNPWDRCWCQSHASNWTYHDLPMRAARWCQMLTFRWGSWKAASSMQYLAWKTPKSSPKIRDFSHRHRFTWQYDQHKHQDWINQKNNTELRRKCCLTTHNLGVIRWKLFSSANSYVEWPPKNLQYPHMKTQHEQIQHVLIHQIPGKSRWKSAPWLETAPGSWRRFSQ